MIVMFLDFKPPFTFKGVKLDESLLGLRMRTSFRTWFRSDALNPKPRAFCYFRCFLCLAMANAFLSTAFALNVWRYSVKEGIQCGASGEHGCGGAWKRSREAAVEVRSRDGKVWECVYETCVPERLRFPTSSRRLRLMQVKYWMVVSDNKLGLQYWSKISGSSILWIACVGIW